MIETNVDICNSIARLSSNILGEITFDVYVLSDNTKKITYIASKSAGISQYYIGKIFSKDVTITKIKKIYVWELRKFVNSQDAVLIDTHKAFARFFNGGILVPYRVSEVLDVDVYMHKQIRRKNQKIKKVHKYDYEITNDPDMLKFFYEKMHIPHVKRKYGHYAHIESFSIFEKILKNGDLILIKFNGENVAGSLNETNGKVYDIKKFGVLDESFVKDGALIAAYYFAILRAKEKKLKMVDFGGSKPFLLDGVLRHKISWGAKICMDKTNKRVVCLKNISFIEPFIYIEDKKLKADISHDHENDGLIKEYNRAGLELNIIK